LEAALIVAIVASYLKKIGKQNLNTYLYRGAFTAIVASVLLGLATFTIYGGLSGASAEIFEGVASLTATVVLTYMILWMTRHAQTLKTELERKVEAAVTKGQVFGIIGAAAASIFVILLATIIVRSIYRLNIKKFFQVTSVILIIFAAGMIGYGVHELIEAGESSGMEFGVLGQDAFDINPPRNLDGSYSLFHEKGAVGSVFAALVGYDGNPEWLRVIVYVAYWLVLATYMFLTFKRKPLS